MRTYKPRKHRSKEEQAKINVEVAKRKAKLAEKYNTDTQYYKGIPVELIVREDYGCYKAKRFKINGSNQNVWIPNCYLEDDGTIKANMNIDFVFKIAAIGIIVAVLNQLLIRSGREDQAMMTTLAGLVVVLSILVKQISALFVTIKSLFAL